MGSVDHAHPPDRPASMDQAELRRDQEIIALLLLADHLERDSRPLGEPQVLRAECAFAVVVEGARLADQVEDLLDSLVLRGRNLLPPRNGEPAFRASGQSRKLFGAGQRRTGVQTVEVLGELHELFADRLHGIPRRIAAVDDVICHFHKFPFFAGSAPAVAALLFIRRTGWTQNYRVQDARLINKLTFLKERFNFLKYNKARLTCQMPVQLTP